MTDIETIYKKLSHVISKEDFLQRIQEKVENMGGLCDETMAAMLVANELGFSDAGRDSIKIENITPESGPVNFIARIISVFDTKEFTRNDGTIGRVGNLIVGDETGKVKLTLWDNMADLIKMGKIKAGQSVQVSGFAKQGYSGVEVNIGNNGVLTESEEEIDVVSNSYKIKDIKDGMGDINLNGKVLEVSEIRTFQRKDGNSGRVGNLMLGDETGTLRVTLWDDKTDFLSQVEYGDSIELINAYARENAFSQKVELQVGNRSIIRKSEKKIEYEEEFTPIDDIKADMNNINISGRILDISEVRTFEKKDGSTGRVGNVLLGDSTGKIRLTLWDEKTDILEEIDFDETVEVLNAYSRENTFSQQVELNLGARGIIQRSEKKVEYREKFTDIADIIPGESYSIQGKVAEIGELREFEKEDGTENVVANLQLKDDTGSIRLTLWGEQAYVIEDLDIDSEIQIIDAYARYGLNEEIELSVGNRSRVIIL
ncbi:Replication factor-A protein [Methanosarcina mazei Go1]|jgi:replication factor A1|uniref:Replication factor-A protein n=1 Tax=Methanosarcina mazei (strain ATCC BAA-159 / DSM 3647 / Goe1 / Go1 / JCM 11833 / OCM 88) TaxID=192952 RepID=Q8PXC2_METMA|nr:OB-fold nucleic acid binding domain-containing protein [Methanosarcina mazei]AAM30995.1 Replication factor-A protein [Methanosarcina mazei Go1]MDY0248103.1 OB-fold nucleic acid binding domain-containing protein [Methanosarcina mazei]WIM44525.1 OB-fold nucleic acid binding domain-containing protein [Methanosarcina mazei]WIM47981.1 OB-fold nucleic acid binding domain-containing protein [Methanosarcina mazei]